MYGRYRCDVCGEAAHATYLHDVYVGNLPESGPLTFGVHRLPEVTMRYADYGKDPDAARLTAARNRARKAHIAAGMPGTTVRQEGWVPKCRKP